MATPTQVSRLETSAGALGMTEQGSAGVPLVFLHGVGSDKSAWAPQMAHFGKGRRTVAFDYPGYGESDPLAASEDLAHDLFAAAILAGLDALQLDRVHLCGLSLGGVVAIAAAHMQPTRFASLIIADSFAIHPYGRAILDRSLAGSADMKAMARGRVTALLTTSAPAHLRDELETVMARIDPAAFRIGAEAVWTADQRERAAAIETPTLVLCGIEDGVTPPALSEELAQLIAGARLSVLPDAGHLPNLEQPTAFNAAVEDFLREIEAGSQTQQASAQLVQP